MVLITTAGDIGHCVPVCARTCMPEDNSGARFSPPAGGSRVARVDTASPSLTLLPDVEQLKHLIIHLILFVRRIALEGVGFNT